MTGKPSSSLGTPAGNFSASGFGMMGRPPIRPYGAGARFRIPGAAKACTSSSFANPATT
eukprot:CAMPEP_0181489806 /NCGR_PEP_ID=MMETSP1110-20121109/49200_1 /TAXON_ID=174948 /ORGANISM="Symbiodinium sp., Strain CCMP421" /LENGTH=58 /DNA_ID=CAMNT_0023616707 /DNA_START=183 /DNA_END=356 /DNA_ORIENTATION=-